MSDPQSLNLYSYVHNNPLTRTDPDGHCDVDGEHHGWVWCAAHTLGFTETKKETSARVAEEAKQAAAKDVVRKWWAANHPNGEPLPSDTVQIGIIPFGMTGGLSAGSILKILEQDGTAISAIIQTVKGDIEIMANMTKVGDKLVLDGVHVGEGVKITNGEIRAAAQELGRQQGVTSVEVRGGVRTAGAIAGQAPQPFTVKVN
jgi:hypothetical protein